MPWSVLRTLLTCVSSMLSAPKSPVRWDKKSVLSQHEVKSGHRMDSKPLIEKITVLDREPRDSHRKVLESIHIKLRGAILNCNGRIPTSIPLHAAAA